MRACTGYIVLVCAVLSVCTAHKPYQKMIPNGERVPDPCTADPGDTWERVGHDILNKTLLTPEEKARDQRNQFGLDFSGLRKQHLSNTAMIWSELCESDSDLDGRTNGEELGDPLCLWRIGDPNPGDGTGLSHPGIKEEGDGSLSEATRAKYCI